MNVAHARHANPLRCGERNQDAVLVGGDLFMVADGLGGHALGREASHASVDVVRRVCRNYSGPHIQRGRALRASFTEAHRTLRMKSKQEADSRIVATTATALWLCEEGRAWLMHVGDSRLYRFRNGCLTRLSRDHSLLESYQSLGVSLPVGSEGVCSNTLVRALGHPQRHDGELSQIKWVAGDVFLLTTDGLTSVLSDRQIEFFMAKGQGKTSDAITQTLLQLALKNGVEDDLGFIVLMV